MACTSFTLPTSPRVAPMTEDIFKEHVGLHRSHSRKELHNGGRFRRSYSDNNLVYPINRIQATATQPKLRISRSVGIFPFQFSSSILPNLFDPEASKDMNIVEKDMNIEERLVVDGSKEEEIKRSNWVERLLEIRSHWRNRQQKERVGEDVGCEEDGIGDRDCGGDESGCAVCYGSDEGGRVVYDRETFSRLLVRVAWSDTKLFSQLAFLCNMAYVIPAIKVYFPSFTWVFLYFLVNFLDLIPLICRPRI
jgi:hypothetical protein